MRVGLITCLKLPEPDPDAGPLAEELQRRGHESVLIPWDGPEWDGVYGTQINVLRSTWNYYRRPVEFLAWVNEAAKRAPLINPLEVVRWNIHKRYLAELQDRGVPMVPTWWLSPGERIDVRAVVEGTGWRRVVIKPAVSAASYRTRAFEAHRLLEAQQFADALRVDGDVLVQQFLAGYAEPGERSLIWIGGEWTHAVRKQPRLAGEVERVQAGTPPEAAEVEVGNQAIATWRHRLSYARVDLVRDESGRLCVSELELIEPSLFFNHCTGSAARFVDAIEAAVKV